MADIKEFKSTSVGAMEIVVDDGSIVVPIKNTLGEEVGKFRINPTDIGIIKRYNDIATKFDDIVAPLVDSQQDDAALSEEESDAETIRQIEEAEKRLYEAIDYLFGGNVSSAFFGKINPFSPVGGKFYCEVVIEAVGIFIGNQFDSEVKKINKRIGKYVTQDHKKSVKKSNK